MTTTNHLGITLVEQSQAQKEVTVNQAFTRIDAVLNSGAISRIVNTPPGSPASGDLYIVGSSPTGAWSGQASKLVYFDQIWRFITPREGMSLWVNNEDLFYTHNGSSWAASTLAISQGGTGQTTANAALNALLPSQTGNNGKVLSTNGTNTSWSAVLTSANGGTGNGFTKFNGPASSEKTFTLPNASDTVVCIGTKSTFTKQQNFGTTTLTDGATINWDLDSNQVAKVTLGGNRTLANPTNMADGGTYILRVIQDGTGSRTLAYGANYKWPGGTVPTLSTGANAIDILTFISNGTAMYGVAQKAFA